MSADVVAIALVAIVIGALLKSISGLGLPLVAVPVVSIVADLETAATVIALPNLLVNLTMAWRTRAYRDQTRDLPMLAATGAIGGVIGTFILVSWPEEPLVGALVAVVLVYIVVFVVSPEYRMPHRISKRWSPYVGTGAGVLQGAIGISGPVVGSWIHGYRLERSAHIFAVTTMFSLSGGTQFLTLAARGELSGRWTAALLGCIPALATIPFGERLRNRFSSKGFDQLVVGTITVTVAALAIRTFA